MIPIIDKEFQSLIPQLSDTEFEQLEKNILAEGIRDALVIWNGIILDGHNRFAIAQAHGLKYKTTDIELEGRDAAIIWIIHNQLGRRNLTPQQSSYLRGKWYNQDKQAHGGQMPKGIGQNDQSLFTAERIAKETGVTDRTIRRDADYTRAVDKIAEAIGDDARTAILASEVRMTKKDVKETASLVDTSPDIAWQIVSGGMTVNAANKELKKRENQKKKETPETPIPQATFYDVHPGQVWRCGRHTVICGDCLELINTITADAVITDPPYGIDYQPDWNKWDGSPSGFKPVTGDDKQFDPSAFMNYPTVLLFGANYFSNSLPIGGWLCWDKRTKEELDAMFGSPFELAWYRSQRTTRKAIMVRLQHGGVVNADSKTGNNDARYHPTQKPVALMQIILDALTNKTETILDPYAGVGSTLLACENTGNTCISIEIEPDNVAIILKRYEDKTGETPCLE